jgi:hypothetical protein
MLLNAPIQISPAPGPGKEASFSADSRERKRSPLNEGLLLAKQALGSDQKNIFDDASKAIPHK